MARKFGKMGEFDLDAMAASVDAAISILSEEEANAIIGRDIQMATTFAEAARNQGLIIFGVVTAGHGLDPSPEVIESMSKHMAIMTAIARNAYAQGLRDGGKPNGSPKPRRRRR